MSCFLGELITIKQVNAKKKATLSANRVSKMMLIQTETRLFLWPHWQIILPVLSKNTLYLFPQKTRLLLI